MKKLFIIVFAVLAVSSAFGKDAPQYEKPMLDMYVPSGLENNQMYVNFGHKLYRSLANYPSNDIFALVKSGANFNIGLRYMIWNGIEVNTAYDTSKDEKNIGASYAMKFPQLFFNAQAGLQFFDYEDPARGQQARNFFYSFCAQTVPLLDDRFTAAIDLAWDGYLNAFRTGIGVNFEVIKNLSISFEYYPIIQGDEEESAGPEVSGVYGFGIKYATYGHQFMLKFGNSPEIEAKQLVQGVTSQDIYVGFSIMRLIDFNPEEQPQ
jgi:hypothetical protein